MADSAAARAHSAATVETPTPPLTDQNVVNYTAVVDVHNQDGKLLPGMTATVDFLIETASNVLKVANAGLRFTPSEEVMAAFSLSVMTSRTNERSIFSFVITADQME